MLIPSSGSQFISRIFTDATGRQFRLTFLVAIVGSEYKGRLISAEPLSSSSYLEGPAFAVHGILALPFVTPQNETTTAYIPAYAPEVSPYYSALEFLIHSQPTRAPSRK